ncbi:MAG: response regulator transcription factor [Saprospiraceae bacterium]|nr:response regulator transcription factor [Saprospiraceae bacterium]MCB9326146.1 response regulator transcription factor [Lewinellaceae bacterium]
MKSHFNCIIIEDVAMQRENLANMLSTRLDLKVIEQFESADTAYEFLCSQENNRPDIMFLDIQLAEFNGLDLLKAIQKLNQKPKVIITTAHPQYAVPSYDYNVSGYVLKPLEMDKLNQAIDKVIGQLQQTGDSGISASISPKQEVRPYIPVKEGNKIINVFYDEIIYLEGANVNVNVITPVEVLLTRDTLKNMAELLNPSSFVRVHDSFIINMDYLKSYAKNLSSLDLQYPGQAQKHPIPIGKKYREMFRERILKNE